MSMDFREMPIPLLVILDLPELSVFREIRESPEFAVTRVL